VGWAAGPDALVVHGQNLQDARFAVQGENVKLARSQTSDNGHWAFLWLDTRAANAQTLELSAVNNHGQARQPLSLANVLMIHMHIAVSLPPMCFISS
jgi:neopullulanase